MNVLIFTLRVIGIIIGCILAIPVIILLIIFGIPNLIAYFIAAYLEWAFTGHSTLWDESNKTREAIYEEYFK